MRAGKPPCTNWNRCSERGRHERFEISLSFRRRPESSMENTPRSGQNHDAVPLAREIFNPLDSGLRRNDAVLSGGESQLNRYSTTAIALHWLVALLIFATFPLGLYMVDLPLSPDKLKLYSYHKWIGVTVFLLVAIRLGWRLTHTPPALPNDIAAWQRRASAVAHGFLYALMGVIPVSGWLMSSAKGFQTVWFGVLPLPDLVERNRELGDLLATVHQVLKIGRASCRERV